MNLSTSLAPAAMAAFLCLPAAALAQSSQAPAPAAPQGAPPPAAASSPLAGHPVAGKNAEERVENRIRELHAQLHITPAEQQQWELERDKKPPGRYERDSFVQQRINTLTGKFLE